MEGTEIERQQEADTPFHTLRRKTGFINPLIHTGCC